MFSPEIEPNRKPSPASVIRPRILDDFAKSTEFSQTGFHRGPNQKRKGFLLIAFSWAAAIIDSFLLVGMALIFVVVFSFVTRLDLSREILGLVGFLVIALLSITYMIMLRSFLGFTLGEWACSLRLGSPVERQSKFYSLRVILRTLVVFGTGILPLPLLALLTGRDIAGKLTGVRLISLK